jgi:hypothetical protein
MAIDKKAKEIVKEIKDLRELLKEDLEVWDSRSLPGKIAQHAQARNRLVDLETLYAAFVGQNVAAIFVSGAPELASKFAELAQEKGGTITIDALGIYKVLAAEVFPILRRNQVDFDHVAVLSNTLTRLAIKARYWGPMNVRFTKLMDRNFTSEEALIEAIRPLCKDGVGELLQMGYVSAEIVDRAFASETTNSPVPCVILNAGEDDKAFLTTHVFGDRIIDVTLEGDVVPNTVTKAFNELKKKLKSNTNENTEENN